MAACPLICLWAPLEHQQYLGANSHVAATIVLHSVACLSTRLAVRLFGTVVPRRPTVPSLISADGRLTSLSTTAISFAYVPPSSRRKSVSFFSGDMCIVHFVHFDWLSKGIDATASHPPDLHIIKLRFILESAIYFEFLNTNLMVSNALDNTNSLIILTFLLCLCITKR